MATEQTTIKIRKDDHEILIAKYEEWVVDQIGLEPKDRAGPRLSLTLYIHEFINGRTI